jgi:two-component system, sensor histidine kinase and response regulator
LTEITQLFKPLEVKKSCNQEFYCPADITLNLNPIGLKIIFPSLIDNALKYSQLDGHVILSVSINDTHVQIQDDGPGISAEERCEFFEYFYRGTSVKN